MMWSALYFFAIMVTALASTDHEVTFISKAQTVFTMNGTGLNGRFQADFDVLMFDRFYSCLCDTCASTCTVKRGHDDSVIEVEEEPGDGSPHVTFSCQAFGDIVCVKESFSGVRNEHCETQSIQNTNLCSSSIVLLEWGGSQQVEAKSVRDNIAVTPGRHCDGKCLYISVTNPISPSLTSQTTRAPTPTAKPPPTTTPAKLIRTQTPTVQPTTTPAKLIRTQTPTVQPTTTPAKLIRTQTPKPTTTPAKLIRTQTPKPTTTPAKLIRTQTPTIQPTTPKPRITHHYDTTEATAKYDDKNDNATIIVGQAAGIAIVAVVVVVIIILILWRSRRRQSPQYTHLPAYFNSNLSLNSKDS